MIVSKDIFSSNFFELFDLPVSYHVDVNKIQQQYMKLQKQVHPDKFANGSDLEKRISMQQTSAINEAQTTLKDPVLRAIYLLKLKGVDFNLQNETTRDTGFLMQQLEIRESLENIKTENDPLATLDLMAKELKFASQSMMDNFAQAVADDKLDDGQEWIRKLQFMQKAKNEVNELINSCEDELLS